jgi:hypothetical protein
MDERGTSSARQHIERHGLNALHMIHKWSIEHDGLRRVVSINGYYRKGPGDRPSMDITTAILLIDMIARYRDRGVPRDQAVMEACPQRLRPILMTSMITIIVMVTVAFFPRTGMDAYQPLGTVILGGLIVGTILSLFDIPIMHTYIDDLIRWLNLRFLKRKWAWPVREHSQPTP